MDETEFEEFVHRYGADILRFCKMSVTSVSDGDELYQETLLRLWNNKSKLDPTDNIKSYALSTAINILKNKKRKQAWRNRIAPMESYDKLQEQSDFNIVSNTPDPLDMIISEDIAQLVRSSVRLLPERYSRVIILYYSADLSVSEIADILHTSANTIKTRLRRAREILKKELEDKIYG